MTNKSIDNPDIMWNCNKDSMNLIKKALVNLFCWLKLFLLPKG